MGKFDGVLLASDFDNTLVYTERALRSGTELQPPSRKNCEALEYFMAEGGRFAVATGRALPAFARYADGIPMNAPCVVCNGAVLHDFARGETVEAALLEGDVRRRVQTVLDRFPEVAAEAYHVNNVIYAVQPNEATRQHEHVTRVAVTEAPSLLDVPLPLGKILLEGEHAALEEALAFLRAQSWSAEYELVFSQPHLLEFTAKGADKAGMVRRLAQRLGISMEHVYCVGDEANDLTMLAAAARGFAPSNCAEAVRKSGATIVSHADEDAIAAVVEILDRIYGEKK
ncbi:MAG: HAD family phosphatase [Ruminococcaceae bacterium]|nr:HAD family phosphatase [Oscillospiraceae bacterium]